MRRVPGVLGERLEGDTRVAPGAGPPMHVHHHQEEAFTVKAGRIGYQVQGGPEQFAEAGETVVFKAGVAHRFWNAGTTELWCAASVDPADNVEYLLTELFAAMQRNGGTKPSLFDAAFLVWRYRSEYAMSTIPMPVQMVLFPILVAVGTLLGKYGKYRDAPEPVIR
jgi:quercetin dioxygenase-like cupin family protein